MIRWTKAATSVACPYPYPEAKVYDPNGFYEEAGQPGPYFEGIWNGWMSLQPDGRPDVDTPNPTVAAARRARRSPTVNNRPVTAR